MRPVHEPPSFVPLIQAAETEAIADAGRNARRDVDIVRDQHGVPLRQLEHEPLVAYLADKLLPLYTGARA